MKNEDKKWLDWAIELQSLAQAGLTYGKDAYDRERYQRIREISAEILACKTDIPVEKVKDLFCNETGYQTPKLDTRAAIFNKGKILLVRENNGTPQLAGEKNNEEQIKMCFEAYENKNWTPILE